MILRNVENLIVAMEWHNMDQKTQFHQIGSPSSSNELCSIIDDDNSCATTIECFYLCNKSFSKKWTKIYKFNSKRKGTHFFCLIVSLLEYIVSNSN